MCVCTCMRFWTFCWFLHEIVFLVPLLNNLHARLVGLWSVRLVRTPLFLLTPNRPGISQVEQKTKTNNKQREEGKKKKRNMDSVEQNIWRWGLWYFCYSVCMHVWLSRELRENPTQQPKMLGNLWSSSSLLNLAILTPCCPLTARHPSRLRVLDSIASYLRLDWLASRPGLDCFMSFTWQTNVLGPCCSLLLVSRVHVVLGLCVVIVPK